MNGEGLQHQDGHSHLIASTIPTLKCYDPAFMYEITTIVLYGLKEMYVDKKDLFYYLTIGNENYLHQSMPKGAEEGILKGLYKFNSKTAKKRGKKPKAHIFGSGSIINLALEAQDILTETYGVDCDVWSATSYKQCRTDAINCDRINMLNPTKERKKVILKLF